MKKSIVFACRWDRVKEKSWSGSKYAVYKELKEKYELEQLDIKDTVGIKLMKLLRKLRIYKGNPSILPIIHKYNKKYKDMKCYKSNVIFQFDETPWTSDTSNYIYQDLAVEYIKYIKENDKVAYKYSGFSNLTDLEERSVLQKEYYEHCSGIFCMGKWLADFLKDNMNIDPNKIHVVEAGINTPITSPDFSHKTGKKILFVGKDFYRKGGELVLDAFRIFRKKYMPTAELYIVGPMENPIKSDDAGMFFVGNVSTQEVAKYYDMCDIFCMPSYFEAFGIVFCEALVCGLPCIARNKYSMPEIIKNGEDGYLIDSDDPEELAEKMNLAFSDKTMFETVRSKRQYYIDRFSWKNVVSKMTEVIDKNAGW